MSTKVVASIVIPTLNEENFLPKLLDSINKQTLVEHEVIIADAGSKDDTLNIAKKYGVKVVKGGLPSVGRNAGAKVAKGKYLFFIDSDAVLSESFLDDACDEMEERDLNLTVPDLLPVSINPIHLLIKEVENVMIRLLSYSKKPVGFGICIIASRELFDKSYGFDEKVIFAEDSEFLERYSKISRFRVLNTIAARVSMRRYEKEGYMRFAFKGLINGVYRMLGKEVNSEIVKYEFGKYDEKKGLLNRVIELKEELIMLKDENIKDVNLRVYLKRILKLIIG